MRAVLTALLVVVEIVSAVLLIGVILIQKTKSQGMGLAFGSGMGESLFGAQIGNVITKITVTLAIVFLLNTALLAVLQSGGMSAESVTDSIAVQAPVAPPPQPPQPPAAPPIAVPEGSVLDVSAPAIPEATTATPEAPSPEVVDVPVAPPEAAAPAAPAPAAPEAATPAEEAANE